jgi:SAM-dependent methyltransferase
VVQLPQSTVSRHLRILSGRGLAGVALGGDEPLLPAGDHANPGVPRAVGGGAGAAVGRRRRSRTSERVRDVLPRRTESVAGVLLVHGGDRWDGRASGAVRGASGAAGAAGAAGPGWEVGDLGCGTGGVAETVARYVKRVVAVDESPAMLEAARRRLAARGPRRGGRGAEGGSSGGAALPDGRWTWRCCAGPALRGAPGAGAGGGVARAAPGGRVLVVDMVATAGSEYRERMGHLWQGFEREQLEGWLAAAGFVGARLPPAAARGRGAGRCCSPAVGRQGMTQSGTQRADP